jgi:hypothetical protein
MNVEKNKTPEAAEFLEYSYCAIPPFCGFPALSPLQI